MSFSVEKIGSKLRNQVAISFPIEINSNIYLHFKTTKIISWVRWVVLPQTTFLVSSDNNIVAYMYNFVCCVANDVKDCERK